MHRTGGFTKSPQVCEDHVLDTRLLALIAVCDTWIVRERAHLLETSQTCVRGILIYKNRDNHCDDTVTTVCGQTEKRGHVSLLKLRSHRKDPVACSVDFLQWSWRNRVICLREAVVNGMRFKVAKMGCWWADSVPTIHFIWWAGKAYVLLVPIDC